MQKIAGLLSFVFILLLFSEKAFCQSTIKLYGTIKDQQTNKPLFGANVVVEGTGVGAASDERGFYFLENLFVGFYSVSVSHIGYMPSRVTDVRIPGDQPVQLNIQLTPNPIEMQGIIVTAPRRENQPEANVTIISQSELVRKNVQSVGELLTEIPGVEIQSSGASGSQKVISIRGSQSNQVLVLLDGVPLNDQTTGNVDLATIPTNMIDQVEIYKGGRSAQFGSGAIGGVINIVTKSHFKNQLQLNSAAGSYGLYQVEPNWSGNYRTLSYFCSYHYTTSKGDFPYTYINSKGVEIHEKRINADFLNRNLFVRINYDQRGHQFSVQTQQLQSERGMPGKIDGWTAYARSNKQQQIYGANYRFHHEKIKWEINYRYSLDQTENSNLYPPDADKRYRRYPKYHYQYHLKNSLGNFTFEYLPGNWLHLKAGYQAKWLDYQYKNLRTINASTVITANDFAHGLFLHPEWKIGLPWHFTQFMLTPAIRYDHLKINSEAQPRVEAQWSPGVSLLLSTGNIYKIYLKSNFSHSFRMPTFADLFYQEVRIEGKPDLLSEKSRQSEIGAGVQISTWGYFHAEITAFHNRINDLIVWRMGSFEVFRPFNTDAEIWGQEYWLSYDLPGQWLSLQTGYTRLEPVNKNPNQTTYNKIIPYQPQHSLKANLKLNFHRCQASVQYRQVGQRFLNEANTKEMPAYHVWDFSCAWSLPVGSFEFLWKFSVFNLTNERYEIIRDMPLPLREFRVGLHLSYQ